MKHSSGRTALVAAIAAALGAPLVPVPGEAQEGAAAGVEEIVVTARRREESLADVPMAITAFSGAELDRLGTQDLVEVAKMTPNVTLEVSRGTNTTLTAFIRGVGQQDPVAGFESGVGVYLDDVYLNRPQAAVLDIYDVERIEVLRGPQGTLYGRNTIGGAIKYVTRRLSDEPETQVRFSVGSYNQMDAVVTGSVPLGDTFRVGASIAKLTRDGFGDNLNQDGVENYNKDLLGVRASAEWDATEDLFFRLSADYIDDQSEPRQGHRLTVGNLSGAPILDDVYDTRAGLSVPEQSVESTGVALTADWQLNDAWTLRNILSYREDTTFTPIDFDSLPDADLDVPAVYENEQFSEELQLLFEGERISGLIGAYWLDANAYNDFDVILGTTGDLLGLPGLNANTIGDVDTESWALFGDITWQATDTVSVSLGGRYTYDERSSRVLRQTYIGGTTFGGNEPTVIAVTSDFDGSNDFSEFTPRASVSWQPNDRQNLYVSYSDGFKGGSFDPRGQTSATPDLDGDGDIDEADIFEFMAFDPEYVTSYEIGMKSAWLDNRVTTGLALFYADYTDVQIPGSVGFDSNGDGTEDTFIGITSNAGEADMLGIEFEGAAAMGEHFDLGWSLGYIDAEYNEFIDAFGVDVADERVFQNTPEWTANATLTYSTPLTLFSSAGQFFVITALTYRDDTSQFETPTALLDQEAYTLWDLGVAWEDDDGHWRAGLYGKNLTDEEYKVAGYYFPALGLERSITAFYGNPSTVTATVEYRF